MLLIEKMISLSEHNLMPCPPLVGGRANLMEQPVIDYVSKYTVHAVYYGHAIIKIPSKP